MADINFNRVRNEWATEREMRLIRLEIAQQLFIPHDYLFGKPLPLEQRLKNYVDNIKDNKYKNDYNQWLHETEQLNTTWSKRYYINFLIYEGHPEPYRTNMSKYHQNARRRGMG